MKSELRANWLIAIALIGWLLYLLAPVLTPFIAAGLLAYIGDPLADRLQRLHLPRTLAVVTVFLLTFLFLGLLVLLLGPLVSTQIAALFAVLPDIAISTSNWAATSVSARFLRATVKLRAVGAQRSWCRLRSRAGRLRRLSLVCS